MISIILYGRNDSYGYNLPKRAAISLNCLAEILSDPDDEILFVDCNTPNELPTFVEANYDTLTLRAKARLRVLRVRPELHKRLVGPTHLMVVEPHPRNLAIRRSNPKNHWVLNTNTDVILLPRAGYCDLTDAVRDLPDGLYTLPRFELPEPLWESFPRSDPAAVLEACARLGPRLHLDEVTLSFPESRYDQVGDFQLAPRQTLWEIHGFDERMIHGWHCDSNISKRLWLYFGRTESLAGRMKAYHCDHTRVETGNHTFDVRLDNNVQQFVFAVNDPFARHQADTWGAPNETVEELDFARDPQVSYPEAVGRTLGGPQASEYVADALGIRDFLSVQAEHVLPYVASDLTVFRPHARFAYIGNHPRLLDLTTRCIAEMGYQASLEYAACLLKSGPPPQDARSVEGSDLTRALLERYDLLIFDFSLNRDGLQGKQAHCITDWPRELRDSLGAVARCLEHCAEKAGAGGTRVPEIMVINANHHIFWNFVNQFLLLTATPYATHVRKGRPRLGEERRYRSNTWKHTEDYMRSFFGYDLQDDSVPQVGYNQSVDFTSAGAPGRFKDGHWGSMDYTGTWTDGERAAFVFRPPSPSDDDLVVSVRVNEALVGPEGEPIRVEVLLDGVHLAEWSFFTRYELVEAKVTLPAGLLQRKPVCRLEFHIRNPQSAARVAMAAGQQVIGDDPRMLGIKVQRLAFHTRKRLWYNIGATLEFTAHGTGAAHTNECWSLPDDFGVWTLGPCAALTLLPSQLVTDPMQAVVAVNDVAVNDAHPTQTVRVLCNGVPAATWTLGPARDAGECVALLPAEAVAGRDAVTLAFEVLDPRTPVQLGWSDWDRRPLGLRLSRLRIAPAGPQKYRLRDNIDFVEGGNSLAFLGDAAGTEWSLPAPKGSWTIGAAAGFRVRFAEPVSGDLPAVFVISDCAISPGYPRLTVTVKANGSPIAEWAMDERRVHRRSAVIPAAALADSPELTLTFAVPDPQSPAMLGWGADTRPLGLQLARAVIGTSDVEIPKFKVTGRDRPLYQRILGLPQYTVHVARVLARRYLR